MNFFLALGLALASSVGALVVTGLVTMGIMWFLGKSDAIVALNMEKLLSVLVVVNLAASTAVWFVYFFIQFMRGM